MIPLEQVYDERFARQYGFLRPYVKQVIYRYLDCGVLYFNFRVPFRVPFFEREKGTGKLSFSSQFFGIDVQLSSDLEKVLVYSLRERNAFGLSLAF